MIGDSDLALRAAALGFACVTGHNSLLAVREQLPGEPFGITVPLSVLTGSLVGWGSAIAAPWPMPAAALLVAFRKTPGNGRMKPALVSAGIGVVGIVGILTEPNTYKAQSWAPETRRAVGAHIVASAVLAGVGTWILMRPRRPY